MQNVFLHPVAAQENLEVVPAVDGFRVRVHGMALYSVGGSVVNFHAVDGTVLFALVVGATTWLVVPIDRDGWFENESGEALLLNVTNDCYVNLRYSRCR